MIKRAIYAIFMTIALSIIILTVILSFITSPLQYILFDDAFKILEITDNFLSKIKRKVVDICFGNKTINNEHM